MAISTVYAEGASWMTNTSPKSTTVSWATDDYIVVAGATENNDRDLGLPSLSGVTFIQSQNAGSGTGGGTSQTYLWISSSGGVAAKLASGGSASLSITASGNGSMLWGFGVWVVTGADTYSSTGNTTSSTISRSTAAGDLIVYCMDDWTAGTAALAGATGSGTLTEREDSNDGGGNNHRVWAGDWLGTAAGTFGFGISGTYPSNIAHVLGQFTAAATFGPPIMQRRRGPTYDQVLPQ